MRELLRKHRQRDNGVWYRCSTACSTYILSKDEQFASKIGEDPVIKNIGQARERYHDQEVSNVGHGQIQDIRVGGGLHGLQARDINNNAVSRQTHKSQEGPSEDDGERFNRVVPRYVRGVIHDASYAVVFITPFFQNLLKFIALIHM